MNKAVCLFEEAFRNNHKILLVGDFDADGATSCAVAIRAIKNFGYDNVNFIVPNRFEYGYGLTPEIVDLALINKPDLIVTVDNGIASINGVAYAKEKGIKVLITDHHLPANQLPEADAIVNPNQSGCSFSSKALCGVGVIFYVMVALRQCLRDQGWFEKKNLSVPNLADLLDLVALGTVADVVPLDENNRILVEHGLRRIRRGAACAGIKALLAVSGKHFSSITSTELAFSLAPKVNAAGRLDDISLGIACLLTDSYDLAFDMAQQLDMLNKDRQQIEQGMKLEAEKTVKLLSIKQNSLPYAISLFNESWHQGVVGILASRIKEKYHRPVICFALASHDDDCKVLKGSARSINGFHIRDALDAIATENPGLIEKFGGHAMAAGLTISKDKFDLFEQAFNQLAQCMLSVDMLQARILTDGDVTEGELSLDNARLLKNIVPWGQQNPEPQFEGEFEVINHRIVGDNHLKLVVRSLEALSDSATVFDAIAFNADKYNLPDPLPSALKLVYSLDVNIYKGRESVQLLVRHIVVSS